MATHASMGAKGIVMRFGQPGIWYFDTGSIATVANAEFTPTLISLTDKSTKQFTGDLNNITENMVIDCTGLANAPGTGWFFIQHFAASADPTKWATQLAYSFSNLEVRHRIKINGEWSGWDRLLSQSSHHTMFYSTAQPTASDGKNGDVWDVYV